MNFKKNVILSVLILIAITFTNAAEIDFSSFNTNLTESERQTLKEGKVVIKKLEKLKQISMCSKNEYALDVVSQAQALKPAYLSEIINIIPYEKNENLIEKLESAIMDIEHYAGIPYWSEHNKVWVELYSSAKILSSSKTDGKTIASADLEMVPFGHFTTDIICQAKNDTLFYSSTNSSKLKYNGNITCVNPERMKSLICVYRQGDYWIMYGLGAVDAPSVFFLKDRIELSFMNRIKTFCAYFFEKL